MKKNDEEGSLQFLSTSLTDPYSRETEWERNLPPWLNRVVLVLTCLIFGAGALFELGLWGWYLLHGGM